MNIFRPLERTNQRGAALIFFLFSLFAILAILAIVIDLGRFETIIRSLQHTADAAALSAATTLHATDEEMSIIPDPTRAGLCFDQPPGCEARTSANVKKVVLSILTHGEMIGLDDTAKAALCINQPPGCSADVASFRFDDATSSASLPDWPNYGRITGERGNLKVTVQRLIFCYSGNSAHPVRNYINLDDPTLANRETQFCKTNAVKVTLTLSHINIFFGRILGMTELSSVTTSSVAVTNQPIPITGGVCESTTCSALGIGLLGAYGGSPTTCSGSLVP